MNITDKQLLKQALKVATHDWVPIYLRACNTNGSLKAEAHRELCCTFISVFFMMSRDKVNSLTPCYEEVHEKTQELTGKLETAIGFPIDRDAELDYDDLVPKFFDKFYALATKAIREYKKAKE